MHLDSNVHGYLGLGQRASLICSGQDVVKQAILKGAVKLLLIAEDAAERTCKEFVLLAEAKGLIYLQVGFKSDYGAALGKPDRSIIGVLDQGYAKSLQKKIKQMLGGMP